MKATVLLGGMGRTGVDMDHMVMGLKVQWTSTTLLAQLPYFVRRERDLTIFPARRTVIWRGLCKYVIKMGIMLQD